jgi:inositol 1,4,5-triphosphate receptor type 1/inositol 1,4,5-triphosphate receptor type 3
MVLNVITDYAKLLSNEMLFYMISFINVLMAGGNT